MKLKAFKDKKNYGSKTNPRIIIIYGLIFLILISIVIYQSYALFKSNNKHNFINTKVGEFNTADIKLAVYVEGDKTDSFPTKDSGYSFEKLECTNSGTAQWDETNWKLSVIDIIGKTQCNVYFIQVPLLKNRIIADVTTKGQMKSGNPNFASISSNADTGMYTMADDDGTSYYFRGTKTLLDNNVIFAGFQWKIIRINGDGSIRMIYNGTCPNNTCTINDTGTATQIGTSKFNPDYNNAKYVGYTYDTNTNSTIKTYVENWYNTNLSAYDTYIEDTVYCNDRTYTTSDQYTNYGAKTRLLTNKTPSLKCLNTADKYTKSTAKGNGKLTQKVGLITADEVAIAGGLLLSQNPNSTYYLYTNQNYWTLSPYDFTSSLARVLYVDSTGNLLVDVNITYGVRPSISLNSNTQISGGNGSTSSPYFIITD